MKLKNLFEDDNRVLTNDEIRQLSKTNLMMVSPWQYVDIIVDIPKNITDQQFDQLLRKSFSQSELEELKQLQSIGSLILSPPSRFPLGQLDWFLDNGGRSKCTPFEWKQYVRDIRQNSLISSLEADFKDD